MIDRSIYPSIRRYSNSTTVCMRYAVYAFCRSTRTPEKKPDPIRSHPVHSGYVPFGPGVYMYISGTRTRIYWSCVCMYVCRMVNRWCGTYVCIRVTGVCVSRLPSVLPPGGQHIHTYTRTEPNRTEPNECRHLCPRGIRHRAARTLFVPLHPALPPFPLPRVHV
ncbi:hypothetical protein K504DRAFT_300412 [Pleomassaria siparia CBS 279.74]|uniref:Uncharacterized protein n=1 Tax=Pleomassaria siparia CBS 279.74 TaxID=1314801 RepID=A0A6G1K6T5_9PLEO|nr:hypothetical protein K504DRAFT_300412 [Pleomassaria siparia CBS 279.74]